VNVAMEAVVVTFAITVLLALLGVVLATSARVRSDEKRVAAEAKVGVE
jgi:hypothetical protein